MKIAINTKYGGFSLSEKASKFLCDLKGVPYNQYIYYNVSRDDPDLISVIEQLGSEASNGAVAKIKIVSIPDGVEWQIEEYDGREWIAEKHRTWS